VKERSTSQRGDERSNRSASSVLLLVDLTLFSSFFKLLHIKLQPTSEPSTSIQFSLSLGAR
jgi:hypothetical protein